MQPASPTDPLFGNAASDLMRGAAGTGGQPPSDPRFWEPPTPEELQSRLDGYVIEAFLARGGMGAVYRGIQASLERPVAIKILPPQLSQHDPSFLQRFKQEARAMAQLNHPGIVKVYDFGEMSDGTLYFVMEFVEGTDVARMIAYQGRLSSAHAMAITAHVCDALQYAHGNGIIHRDIKPANIMVGSDGAVKVADFGLAKSFNSGHVSLTMTGHVMGTLNFMAPEALMLGSGVDHRADIYAVGVMLYQMLTGRVPQGLFEMPSLLVPGLDPRYDAIIAAAMREDRDARYQAIHDMRRALDAIITQPIAKTQAAPQQQPTTAPAQIAQPRTNPGQPYRRPPQAAQAASVPKKKSNAAIWLIAAIVVLGLGGTVWMQMGRSEPTPKTKEEVAARENDMAASPASPPAVHSSPAQPVTTSVPSFKLRPSREDGDPSSIRFVNKLSEDVRIQLVDSDGRLRSSSNVKAGRTTRERTSIGQVWLITTKNGAQIGLAESLTEQSTVTINPSGIETKTNQAPHHDLLSMIQFTGSNIGDAVRDLRQRASDAGLNARIELDPRVNPKAGSINLDAHTATLGEIVGMCAYQAGMSTIQDGLNFRIVPR